VKHGNQPTSRVLHSSPTHPDLSTTTDKQKRDTVAVPSKEKSDPGAAEPGADGQQADVFERLQKTVTRSFASKYAGLTGEI
jgi:hypothetical protein